MKRNDVVCERNVLMVCYGRINRVIDEDTVEWIDTSNRIYIDKKQDLMIRNDYKGYYRNVEFFHTDKKGEIKYPENYNGDRSLIIKFSTTEFVRMPTLRKLKQRASKYLGRNVWRLNKRPNLTTEKV